MIFLKIKKNILFRKFGNLNFLQGREDLQESYQDNPRNREPSPIADFNNQVLPGEDATAGAIFNHDKQREDSLRKDGVRTLHSPAYNHYDYYDTDYVNDYDYNSYGDVRGRGIAYFNHAPSSRDNTPTENGDFLPINSRADNDELLPTSSNGVGYLNTKSVNSRRPNAEYGRNFRLPSDDSTRQPRPLDHREIPVTRYLVTENPANRLRRTPYALGKRRTVGLRYTLDDTKMRESVNLRVRPPEEVADPNAGKSKAGAIFAGLGGTAIRNQPNSVGSGSDNEIYDRKDVYMHVKNNGNVASAGNSLRGNGNPRRNGVEEKEGGVVEINMGDLRAEEEEMEGSTSIARDEWIDGKEWSLAQRGLVGDREIDGIQDEPSNRRDNKQGHSEHGQEKELRQDLDIRYMRNDLGYINNDINKLNPYNSGDARNQAVIGDSWLHRKVNLRSSYDRVSKLNASEIKLIPATNYISNASANELFTREPNRTSNSIMETDNHRIYEIPVFLKTTQLQKSIIDRLEEKYVSQNETDEVTLYEIPKLSKLHRFQKSNMDLPMGTSKPFIGRNDKTPRLFQPISETKETPFIDRLFIRLLRLKGDNGGAKTKGRADNSVYEKGEAVTVINQLAKLDKGTNSVHQSFQSVSEVFKSVSEDYIKEAQTNQFENIVNTPTLELSIPTLKSSTSKPLHEYSIKSTHYTNIINMPSFPSRLDPGGIQYSDETALPTSTLTATTTRHTPTTNDTPTLSTSKYTPCTPTANTLRSTSTTSAPSSIPNSQLTRNTPTTRTTSTISTDSITTTPPTIPRTPTTLNSPGITTTHTTHTTPYIPTSTTIPTTPTILTTITTPTTLNSPGITTTHSSTTTTTPTIHTTPTTPTTPTTITSHPLPTPQVLQITNSTTISLNIIHIPEISVVKYMVTYSRIPSTTQSLPPTQSTQPIMLPPIILPTLLSTPTPVILPTLLSTPTPVILPTLLSTPTPVILPTLLSTPPPVILLH